jgi:hypothetical protein
MVWVGQAALREVTPAQGVKVLGSLAWGRGEQPPVRPDKGELVKGEMAVDRR